MASGRFGVVNGMSTVENWNLSESKTADSYVASNTYAGTVRGGGITRWSGSFNGKGAIPPVMPNESFLFEGYTAPDDGTEGSAGTVYGGQAIVSSVSINWDWTQNDILSWTVNFNGGTPAAPELTISTKTIPLDTTIPPTVSACGTVITYGADIEIPALASATLTFTAALSSEVHSGTQCYETWTPGALDWTLTANQQDYKRGVAGYPDLGDDLLLKVYTDQTDFWQLKFGKAQEYSGLTVDRSTGATISRTLNIAMQATDGLVIGNVVKPGDDPETTVYWGVTDTP